MKELFLIRHGSLNEICTRRLVGQNDQPLSVKGIAEAEACGRFLAGCNITAAYSGNLRRVQETVDAVRKNAPDIPEPVIDTRLNEFDFGTWNMRDTSVLDEEEKELLRAWNFGNWDFSFPGGETIQAFADRTRAALKDIFEAEKNTGSVAVFSHGGVLMSLMADIAGLDRSKAFRLWLSRGSLAKIVFDDSGASDGVHMQAGRLCMLLKPAEIFK